MNTFPDSQWSLIWHRETVRKVSSKAKSALITALQDVFGQSWLCGYDVASNKDYSHRRRWIEGFLKKLAGLTCIEIQFHAIMSNHLHLILRARPDLAQKLTDEEVIRRYKSINLLIKSHNGEFTREISGEEVANDAIDPEKVREIRLKLSHPSLLMGALCEHIARRSNREDDKTGRFWEGRYKSQRLDTLGALLLCAIYVELNPIRAKMADTPETARFTSLYHRLRSQQFASSDTQEESSDNNSTIAHDWDDSWLSPFTLDESRAHLIGQDPGSPAPHRVSDRGILPMSLGTFAELVDAAGRVSRSGKPGKIPDDLPSILERLGLRDNQWIDSALNFEKAFGHIVTDAQRLKEVAKQHSKKWIGGVSACRATFR